MSCLSVMEVSQIWQIFALDSAVVLRRVYEFNIRGEVKLRSLKFG